MLHELQQKFKNAILHQDNTPLMGEIQVIDGISPEGRIGIYRNNTFVSLKEALLSTFEITAKLVSIEFFRYLADEYIKAQPPQKGCLLYYGETFPNFIASFEPLADHPYLADLARLEWLMQESINAGDAEAINPEALANIQPEGLSELHLNLMPATKLLASPYPIFSIWQDVQENGGQGLAELDMDQPQQLLITRPEFDIKIHSITSGAYAFLNMCNLQQNFPRAVEEALTAEPDLNLQEMLENFLQSVIFSDTQTNT